MADGYLNFDTKINEKGFNDGISKLGKLGKSGLKVATRAVTALGAAAGTGIAAAVKVGAAFEAEMSKVSAISGATGEDFQKLTDKAKEMGAKTKFSATESAQAMEYMASGTPAIIRLLWTASVAPVCVFCRVTYTWLWLICRYFMIQPFSVYVFSVGS